MPMDMRDAIAHYLAYTGGTGYPQGAAPWGGGSGMRPSPGGGLPGMGGGMPPGFSPSPPGPNPGGPVPPPGPEFYNGGRDIFAPDPSVPSNLQGYERLPSGQFLPGAPPIGQGGPQTPPVDTPMQGPQVPWEPPSGWQPSQIQPGSTPDRSGQLVAGMDPDQWLRMYRGGAGA